MAKNSPKSLSEESLRAEFQKKKLNNTDIFFYTRTDSTNTRAKIYADGGAEKKNAVFLSLGQSAGRGRRGRSFDSEEGAGLYISFLTYPESPTLDVAKITAHAVVALCKTIEELTPLKPKIKWVNDVLVGRKKLAGILTEGKICESGDSLAYAISGIGVNFKNRAFGGELSKIATSIEGECGIFPDLFSFASRLAELYFSENDSLLSDYRDRLISVGEVVTVTKILGESYPAKILGVTDSFALSVEGEKGKEELISAEVSIKL